MAQKNQVPSSGTGGVAGKAMAAPSGVPGDKRQGMAAQGETDAGTKNWEQEYKRLQEKYNADTQKLLTDVDKVRSSLQKESGTWRQRYDQLREEFYQEKVRDLPEEKKVEVYNQRWQEEYENLKAENEQLLREKEDAQAVSNAIRAFNQMGFSTQQLDLNNGLRGVMESGWTLAAVKLAEAEELKAKLQQSEQQTGTDSEQESTDSQTEQSPPNVFAPQGGAPLGKTWGDAIKAAENITGRTGLTEEDVFRAVENGELDHKILPGLDS